MDLRSLIRKPLVRAFFGILATATVLFGLLPSRALALGAEPPPVYPCPGPYPLNVNVIGSSPGGTMGVAFECHMYDYLKALSEAYRKTIAFGVVTALLDSATVFMQQVGEQTANWVYSGFDETPQFFTKEYGAFFKDIAADFYNRQISNLNESFFKDELGWDLCQPISLNLKIGIGIGRMSRIPPPNCTFETVKAAFNETKDSLSQEQIANSLRQSVAFGGNDINIAISANQKILQKYVDTKEERILDRQEGGGFKNVKDLISGRIRQPSQVARDTVSESNLLKRLNARADMDTQTMAFAAMWAGVEQLPYVFAGSFVNTFATRALASIQKMLQGEQVSDPDIPVNLLSFDSDPNSESGTSPSVQQHRKKIISAFFSDIFRPNLNSGEQQDFVSLMSSCPTPRGIWGCTMDQGLAGALRAISTDGGMTVAKAAGLQPGASVQYLHPDWELVPEWEAKDNQDPGCYQRAYCASNLAKLRFARILPVGWELAANSVYNKKNGGKYVTLGEVIAGFNNCNAQGQVDDQHPWCKLINPAWVLTAPPFKCSVQGYTDATLGQGNVARVRVQECVDVVSCLQRDEDGSCVGGYGYCASEKTVWRFGGNQCDEKFASCRSYLKPSKKLGVEPGSPPASTNEVVSYVRNTIDYGACTADNSGCMYYATMRDLTTSTADVWRGVVAKDWKLVDSTWDKVGTTPSDRIYFDNTVKPCSAADDGCTKVLAMEPETSSLNLLQNGSFEQADPKSVTKLAAWDNTYAPKKYVFQGYQDQSGQTDAFAGSVSADFPVGSGAFEEMEQIVPAAGNRYYTISLYGRNRVNGKQGAIQIVANILRPYTGNGPKVVGPTGIEYSIMPTNSPGVTYGSDCLVYSAGQINGIATSKTGLSDAWGRESCTFVTPKEATALQVYVMAYDAAIDAAQAEESQVPTAFVDGVNAGLQVQYLKVPPEQLSCVGNSKVDRAECGNYARVCSQVDAGCQAYTENGGDGTEIPANLSSSDYCPESCVGYAEYRKQPSSFDLVKNTENPQLSDADDDTIANFIPTNSQQCTAAAAGCEEFTNVESQSAGGETKAYFQYARACEKPGANSRTFFTWEGSEDNGYQLKTWSLIADANQAVVQPKVLVKAGPDGVLKDPANCTEATWKEASDLDCRQFYNEGGQVSYRYFSQTVLSSVTCADYRIAVSNIDDCTKSGGNWNSTSKQCIYSIEASQSATCPAQYAGCRGYVGTTGKNSQEVLTDTFGSEKSNAGFVSGKGFADGGGSTVSISKEALLVGDYSLKVTNANDGKAGVQASFNSEVGGLYMVTFWAKTTAAATKTSYAAVQDSQNNRSPFQMTQEWKRFELGPFAANKKGANTLFIYDLPNETYIDEVHVKQLRDVAYVVKDTWVVPDECDRTPEGIPQPQAMLGCRSYHDRNNKQVNVRQFNNLCKFETVGCTGYVDTRNSENPYSEAFEVQGLSDNANPSRKLDNLYMGKVTVRRPADRYVYLIDEPKARCNAEFASCRGFGKPKFDSNWKVTGYDTIYLIDDITKYQKDGEPNALCRPSELFCDAFASNQVVSYFRDPADHTCTWMDKVTLPAASAAADPNTGSLAYSYPKGQYSGWFYQSGTSTLPCYPYLLSNANTFLTESPLSNRYQGFTSNCPKDQSECTEFRDSNDHTDPVKPIGKPYYFINNGRIDVSSCGDVADPFNGCVLIRDMNDGDLRFNAKATYAESHAKGDVAVTPLDCAVKDKDNPNCKGAGTCQGINVSAADLFKSCSADSECGAGKCVMNDSNRVVKVRLDRDCRAWFGCRSGETVYDEAQQKYVDLCTDYALCDRAGGASQGNFCSHYVNRNLNQPAATKITDPYVEPVLREGVFINDRAYSVRPTTFVDSEYSGYTIGNRFQVADLMSRRVGYEILRVKNVKRANDYFDDYRLVAAVPLAAGSAEVYDDKANPQLRLCKHVATGQIGYYIPNELPARCYLAIDTPLTQVVTDVLGAQGNSRNAQVIATVLDQDPNASRSIYLNQVMPGVECKAYPDAQSPFGNEFVKEWDTTVTPNKPKTYAAGYEGVAICERGEDCACQYAKVNYQGNLTKYFGVVTKNAPPQGVCVGGDRDGQACIPDLKQKTTDTFDAGSFESQFAAPINETCGSGSTCQPLQGTSYIRGVSGFCLQRDSAVTVGDKGRYQCLTWHPRPVLDGTKDIYHYTPTAGYLPSINSGEYYCVSPAFAAKEGITLDKSGLNRPGLADDGGWAYDEQCVNAAYKPPHHNISQRIVAYQNTPTDDIPKDDEGFSGGVRDSTLVNADVFTPRTDCKIIDGTDLKKTAMAQWCGQSLLKLTKNTSIATYAFEEDPDDNWFTTHIVPSVENAFFPFYGPWKDAFGGGGFKGFISAAFVKSPLAVVNSLVCLIDGCHTYVGTAIGDLLSVYWDRSTFAVPTMNGVDNQTVRLVTTGEGKDRSYAEYFLTSADPLVKKLLSEISPTAGAGDNILESQIGYFRFHVPQPGVDDVDFADEKSWSTTPPKLSNVFDDWWGYLVGGGKNLLGIDDDELRSNLEPDWKSDYSFCSDPNNCGGSELPLITEGPTEEADFADPQSGKSAFATLGCLMSPEWAGVTVSDWADEPAVKQASDSWYKAFNKNFKGYLSRAKQGYLKTQDGNQLLQLPCQNNSAASCYYKYWELGYQADDQSAFNLFNTTDGALGPTQIAPNKTYFRRAQGDKPYFAIRAMFEDMSEEDNKTSPLQQPTDGSGLRGPFRFVGFWVTAASPNAASSRAIYMRMSASLANYCRDVAQVISPKDRKNAAFTDRVWEQSNFQVPLLSFNYGTENSPFGSALHQRMIGHDPMLMLDTTKGIVAADGTFVKPGQQYWAKSRVGKTENYSAYNYHILENLFARIYQVYQFYDVPVGKNDKMCFFGPFAGRRCNAAADCNPNEGVFCAKEDGSQANGSEAGKCKGGYYNGRDCTGATQLTCLVSTFPLDYANSCQSVSSGGKPAVVNYSVTVNNASVALGTDCQGQGDPNSNDPDKDDNRCTHNVGYYPRPDICYFNPDNIECLKAPGVSGNGFIPSKSQAVTPQTDVTLGVYFMDKDKNLINAQGTYEKVYAEAFGAGSQCYFNPDNIECLKAPGVSGNGFIPSKSQAVTPQTDVTLGVYFMDKDKNLINAQGTYEKVYAEAFGAGSQYRDERFMSAYIPRAPRVAAPDTSRQCASPGQCAIAKMDSLNIDNSTEGPVIYYGSQSYVTLRFYAWGADNQSPLSDMWIDWGDGTTQQVTDARMKNKKPFCGVSKQCEFAPGLTCNSDADCPAAAGKCYGTGFCSNNPGRACRVGLAGGSDCDNNGTCIERLTYGSSPLACEANFFEFKHSYACTSQTKYVSSNCSSFTSGDKGGKGGCSQDTSSQNIKTTCKFVPRVFVKDNWGWCAGNCSQAAGSIANPPVNPKDLAFKNGGCYDGSKVQYQFSSVGLQNPTGPNMCNPEATKTGAVNPPSGVNPWIPYQGVIEMRSPE